MAKRNTNPDPVVWRPPTNRPLVHEGADDNPRLAPWSNAPAFTDRVPDHQRYLELADEALGKDKVRKQKR